MHLARIRIAELSSLEVDDYQATQSSVEEHEINAEPSIVDAQSTLTAKKGEVIPQLQQEVGKILDECGFEIGFRVLVFKVEELQYERIFDRLFWGHDIARLGNLPFFKQGGLILRESNPFIELASNLTV
jgi:hypothetical protein